MKKNVTNESVNMGIENNVTITEMCNYLKTKYADNKNVLQFIEMCNEYLNELKCAEREIVENELKNLNELTNPIEH